MFKRCLSAVCVCSLLLGLSSCQKLKSTLLSNDKSLYALILEANTILPLPSTHELSFTHDDKHLYLFSQEGFFITLDPVSETAALMDRSNDEVLVIEANRLQGTPFIFSDKLVLDRYADRIDRKSVV